MNLPDLGVGTVFWPGLEHLLEPCYDLIDVFEIEPQVFWLPTDSPATPYTVNYKAFEKLKSIPKPKILHGVGFPVGSCRPPDHRHITPLLESIDLVDAKWTSEHLAFNTAIGDSGTYSTRFFLPPQQTLTNAETIAANIRKICEKLSVPFAFENTVNYLRPRRGEIRDSNFIAEVAEKADCGILLDIHNLWTNERNGREAVLDAIERIPLERVYEVHLANGENYKGYWLDAHTGYMPDELFHLAKEIIPRLPNLKAIIFEVMSETAYRLDVQGMRDQLHKMQYLWSIRSTNTSEVKPKSYTSDEEESREGIITAETWEDTLSSIIVRGKNPDSPLEYLNNDPGIDIYRELVQAARSGGIADLLPLTLRLINLNEGVRFTNDLMTRYFSTHVPENFSISEALKFAEFLKHEQLDISHLYEVLEYERQLILVQRDGESRVVHFSCEPLSFLQALGEGSILKDPVYGNYELEIT